MRKLKSILNAMMGNSVKDSNDIQGKDEGKQSVPFFFGSSPQPIFIPSKSQRVKSKRLAKRNNKR